MKSQETLEKEYKGFEKKSMFVKDLEEFIVFIETIIGDIKANNAVTKKEIKNNKRWKLEVKIRNYFLAPFNEVEIDVYDEDTKVLEEISKLDEEYLNYYRRILLVATENTYEELTKLVDFSREYYMNHLDFLEKQREMLELEIRGIHMYKPNNGDSRNEINEFIVKRISYYENRFKNNKQYVKKVI